MSASSFRTPIKPSIGGHSIATHDGTRRKWLQLLGATLILSGCGKKGDLELPPLDSPSDNPSEGGETQ